MPKGCRLRAVVLVVLSSSPLPAFADDQTQVGAGNEEAARLASESPLVRSADRFIARQAEQIRDRALRHETVDAITNRQTCIKHRAGMTSEEKDQLVQQLITANINISGLSQTIQQSVASTVVSRVQAATSQFR